MCGHSLQEDCDRIKQTVESRHWWGAGTRDTHAISSVRVLAAAGAGGAGGACAAASGCSACKQLGIQTRKHQDSRRTRRQRQGQQRANTNTLGHCGVPASPFPPRTAMTWQWTFAVWHTAGISQNPVQAMSERCACNRTFKSYTGLRIHQRTGCPVFGRRAAQSESASGARKRVRDEADLDGELARGLEGVRAELKLINTRVDFCLRAVLELLRPV